MSTYDVSTMKFTAGFKPKNLVLVLDKGRTLLCAFENDFKGRNDYNIRELYEEYGEWNPGKGISVPMERKAELLKALASLT